MSSRGVAIGVMVVVGVVVGYVLSVGTMMWLMAHGYLPIWLAHLYDPLWFIGRHVKPLGAFVEWYILQMPLCPPCATASAR